MKGQIKGEEGASHIVWNLYLILYIRTNFISACMSFIFGKEKKSVGNMHVFAVIFFVCFSASYRKAFALAYFASIL